MKQEEDEADDKDEVLSMEEALADQDEQLRLEREKEEEEKKPKTTRKRKGKDNTGKGKDNGKRAKKKAAHDEENPYEERSPEEEKKPNKGPGEAHPIVMVKSSGGDIDGICEVDGELT